MTRLLSCVLAIAIPVAAALPGEIYEVTSTDGKRTVKYELWFGGGKDVQTLTAFNPQTKKFVRWHIDRSKGEQAKIVAQIWDYKTCRTIDLYRFPGVENPLPIIPLIDDLKICPITGDKNLKINSTALPWPCFERPN